MEMFENFMKLCNKVKKFYFKEYIIDGFKTVTFSYHYGKYVDFMNNNAFEMRGITFVFNGDQLWKVFPAFEKFFNIGEHEAISLNNLKTLEIDYVMKKLDGSLISFIQLPNRKIIAKSKTSFISEHAICANEIFKKDENLKLFVTECLQNNIVPLFELIGSDFKIVVDYSINAKLVLIALRDMNTLKYLPLINTNIEYVDIIECDWEKLMKQKKAVENEEGWVVLFKNGLHVKVKTKWYALKHKARATTLKFTDIVQLILNNQADDLSENIEIVQIEEKINQILDACNLFVEEKRMEWQSDNVKFAQKYSSHVFFHIAMAVYKFAQDEESKMKIIKECLMKKIKTKNILETLKVL
jgi:T4 RnlA family RNA ligase